jgi:hypothetical protein
LLSVGIFSVAAIYIFALNIAILGRVGGDESSRKLSLVFIGNWLPFAIVVDYLSLWKTRVLLTKELFSSSLFSAMAVVIADVLATIVITVVAAISINALFGNGGLAYGNFWLGTPLILHIERAAKFQLLYFQQGFAVSKLEFLPPLLTSAWLWVYLIVAHAMRTVNRVPALLRLLSKVQDFEAHPVRTIGYVAATVSAIFIGIITLT